MSMRHLMLSITLFAGTALGAAGVRQASPVDAAGYPPRYSINSAMPVSPFKVPAANATCTGAWICNIQVSGQASQPLTITQSWTATGMASDAPATSQTTWQGVEHGQLGAGSTFTDTIRLTSYRPAANGCVAQTASFIRAFSTRGDSYSYDALGLSCPMAGHRGETTSTGTLVITGGTGQYAGVSGTGTYSVTGTTLRTRAGQAAELRMVGQGQVNLTFPLS
jgi:hypothetical protein